MLFQQETCIISYEGKGSLPLAALRPFGLFTFIIIAQYRNCAIDIIILYEDIMIFIARTMRLAFALILMPVMLLVSGCSDRPEGPVVIGTNVWPGYEPGYLAVRQKLYGEADVSFRQFLSATEVLRAFRNKTIDVATLTLDEALLLQQSGIPIKVFLVADVSNGADAILARPPIKSMGDLAGKRVGVENSALGAYVLGRALQINGMQERNVKTVSLTVDQTIRLYQSGNVDAVVSFEPFKAELLNLGAVKIFDSSRIPDEIVDVLVTRKEFAETHPNALKAVVKGWLMAANTIKQGSPDVIEELAVRLKLRPREVRDALRELKIPLARENEALLSGTDGQLAQASLKLIPVLEKRNGVQFSFQPEDIITAKLLPDSLDQ